MFISRQTKITILEQEALSVNKINVLHYLFQVIVLWTANTERFCDVSEGLNDTAENLLKSIAKNEEEVSPSTIFAVASILEKVLIVSDLCYTLCMETNFVMPCLKQSVSPKSLTSCEQHPQKIAQNLLSLLFYICRQYFKHC